jgi:isoleucyl-tRNA synthetase
MDVWFDSGTSWSLLHPCTGAGSVANVYLEGTDQHRGWFQSSLLTHIAHQQATNQNPPKAPFETLITHGFTLDQEGRKMSKSLGNTITPDEIVDGTLLPPMKPRKQKGQPNARGQEGPIYDSLGPDALRLWVVSSDYTHDVIIGQPVLQSVHQALHKYRVTFKWLLGALAYYDPSRAAESIRNPNELLDRIAMYQLEKVEQEVHGYFANYEFFKAVNTLNRYINIDLSAFYFETLKDRLYTGSKSERLPAQRALSEILNKLLVMLGPITPLLVEEVWHHAPEKLKSAEEHPLRRVWKMESHSEENEELESTLRYLRRTNEAIKSAQEDLRAKKLIGSGLESDVHIFVPNHASEKPIARNLFNEEMEDQLASIFVVSRVIVHMGESDSKGVGQDDGTVMEHEFELEEGLKAKVAVVKPAMGKCVRCWRYLAPPQNELCGRCEEVVRDEHPDHSSS